MTKRLNVFARTQTVQHIYTDIIEYILILVIYIVHRADVARHSDWACSSALVYHGDFSNSACLQRNASYPQGKLRVAAVSNTHIEAPMDTRTPP